MQIDLQKDIFKDNKYPVPKGINLYYKEGNTTKASTMILYATFAVLVLIAFVKFGVVDVLHDVKVADHAVYENQRYISRQKNYLRKYDHVNAEYSLYAPRFKREDENIPDRMDVLKLFEETVLAESKVSNFVLTGNLASITYSGLTLEQTSALVHRLEGYEMIERVDINTASSSDTEGVQTQMLVTFVQEDLGGEESNDTGNE